MTTDTNVISITRKPEKTTGPVDARPDPEKRKERKEREERERKKANDRVKRAYKLGKA
jgi:hypothetical protein